MKKLLLLLLSVLLILSLTGCFGPPPSPAKKSNIFYNAVKNTAPIFAPDRTSITAKANWNLGSPIYEIYRMFREYDPALDQGTVGLENIYKLMYQAGQFYNDCQNRGTSIADTVMTSPFDFGRTDNTYNKVLIEETGTTRGNYFATKKEGTINYGLLCWYIEVSAAQKEYGVLQGHYDEGSGDINVDLICFVDYSGAADPSKYTLRTHLEGNSQTHNFSKLLTGKWNHFPAQAPGYGYRAWYVGSGMSRGAGEYFLFKVADNGGTLPAPGKYFEFPADADETALQLLSDAGTATTTLTDYQNIIDPLVAAGDYYDVFTDTPSEVPDDQTDFGGTGLGNLKPGEM